MSTAFHVSAAKKFIGIKRIYVTTVNVRM